MKNRIIICMAVVLVVGTIVGWTSNFSKGATKRMYQHNDKNISYFGRTVFDQVEDATYFNWTCSGFEFKFEGNKVEAQLRADMVEEDGKILKPWVAVFVDNFEKPYKVFELDEAQKTYTLFESNKVEKHNIRVVKRTEALHSKTALKTITIYGENATIKPFKLNQKHKIEFIGDSITCGYGNETNNPEDGFQTAQENGWEAFAAKTARNLNAAFNCVSVSGIGVYSNWTAVDQINNKLLMPEIYSQTDTYLDLNKDRQMQKWDFTKFDPELVVINLGTNDMSYIQFDLTNRFPVFVQKYIDFIKQVKAKNGKDTKILCTILAPDEKMKQLFLEIEKTYEANGKDPNVNFLVLSPPQPADGIGGSWHPTVKTHERMSQELTDEIRAWLKW